MESFSKDFGDLFTFFNPLIPILREMRMILPAISPRLRPKSQQASEGSLKEIAAEFPDNEATIRAEKERALGCVNSTPAATGSQGGGIHAT